MTIRRWGEGAEHRRCEAGEGEPTSQSAPSDPPHPRHRTRACPSSAKKLRKSQTCDLRRDLSPLGRGENKNPFSRRTQRPRFANHHNNKALLDSLPRLIAKREAERRKAHPSTVRATLADVTVRKMHGARKRAKTGRARLPALRRGTRQGFDPSAQLRAALPGITGCKREDPPRRQCSEHLADRS